ncbi:Signal recognition particle 54 kDa protein, chloroplastic [Hordeum vulgare]|nr:Signal recognition particle 54 kDa protein, chloroplastic [Hordeum vulgare]
MALFEEFYVGSINLHRLNYGIITLIPKITSTSEIRQFCPITVINVIVRILAKGFANRVTPLADHITHPDQSAFIHGRYILDGVLVFHEAKAAGHIQGMVPHLVDGHGVPLLQYANDTIIIVQGFANDIANLKFLRLCFQQMSGLRINFHKSKVMVMGYSPKVC